MVKFRPSYTSFTSLEDVLFVITGDLLGFLDWESVKN